MEPESLPNGNNAAASSAATATAEAAVAGDKSPPSKLNKLADAINLEHQFLKVPFEHYKKTIRHNNRAVEKELSAFISVVSDVADANLSKDQTVQHLNTLVSRLQGLKRKLEDGTRTEHLQAQRCRARFDHLESADAENFPDWSNMRLNRILVDYMLRMSYYDSAVKLAETCNIQELVDIDVFQEAKKVIDALQNKKVSPALAWCADNKSRLKKSKSTIEFRLRLQEFIELVRADSNMQAIAYARKYLSPWGATHMKELQRYLATLAFKSTTECPIYKDLFAPKQWDLLVDQFKQEFYKLYGMTVEPLLNIFLQAGLSALKTPFSYENDCTKEDPLSQESFRKLSEPLPYSKQHHSKLVCYITKQLMDTENPPMVLPNGYVYTQLVCENGYLKQQLQTASAATTDASCDSVVTTPQHSLRDANNPAGLLSIAEETLAEFLSKATGTAVDWVQTPGMKPGPDSVGIFAISQSCIGVAARACGLVSLEPTKIVEILKDRPSWFRDCQSLEVFTVFPAGNGGTIELVYMQTYAPTTLAPARDFWTLRYTTSLDNGSVVVCERSLSGSGAGPNAAATAQFVRAEMLPSGYLIRPCEGGGSIIHIVDHLNLEAWTVPEVLRPLYESSKVVAQKMTISALRYIRQIAQETSGEVVYGLGRQPAVLRTFSQRLNRGFNDAINGFSDDGWSIMNCDGAEDVVIAVNSSKNFSSTANPVSSIGGVLCAKASMLLQNIPPAVLIRFLREHRSEWADFNVDAYSAASLKPGAYAYPGMRPTRFTGSQIIMPLGHTIEHEELLEVIRLEGHSLAQEDAFVSRDIHLLQICCGVDENSVGACSELVFAPIDEMFPDDAPLLPSGFRIIPLESKSSDTKDKMGGHRTLDLTSSLEVGTATNSVAGDSSTAHNTRSVLTIAFQFPFETSLQENVANMACQYVRSVISSVQRVAMAISPSGLTPAMGPRLSPGSPEALTLSTWISQSYSYYTGTNLLRSEPSDSLSGDLTLKHLWQHQDAILCCSVKSLPVFVFANQAGLDMLETTLVALQDITLDKIFDESGRKALCGDFAKLMEQGFAYLPAGICMSTMGRHISYEQAIAWKVHNAEDNTVHCLAFSFVNWSFV